MNQWKSLLVALALSPMVSFAAEPVSFGMGPFASPRFVKLLGEGNIAEATVKGYQAGAKTVAADCKVEAMRPDRDEAPSTDAKNAVKCSFAYADGKQGTAVLSLAGVKLQRWGNFAEKYPVQFQGPLADKLFGLMKAEYKTLNPQGGEDSADPGIFRLFAASPTGAEFTIMYGYNRMGIEDSTAALICDQSAEVDGSSDFTKGKKDGFIYQAKQQDGSTVTYRSYDTTCKFLYFGKEE